jgi:ABC-type transport system substrate-binding protein
VHRPWRAFAGRGARVPAGRIGKSFVLALLGALAALVVGVAASSGTPARSSGDGTLNWGATILPTTWDPVTSSAGNDGVALNLVYAGLTGLDAKGNPIPALATSWKFSSDGLSLQFTLRKGVKFTDGTPFNADAVKANILRGQQPSSLIAPQLNTIKSITIINPYTIKFNLSSKDYGLPLRLGGKTGMMVSPKAFTSNAAGLATQPVGAGPFELTNLVSGASATLVRNPNYWDAKDILLKGVNIQQITNPQTLLAALQSGQVDVAMIPGAVANTAKSDGFEVKVVPSLSVASIEVNAAMPPFQDHKVIEAINYALDRAALKQTANAGIGGVDDEPFPAGYVGYSKAVANYYTYNPQKAKQILAADGHASDLSFTITYFPLPPYDAVAQQIQGELQAVGINTTLAVLPLSQAAQAVYVDHNVAFNPNGIVGRESPLQMLDIQYASDGLLNPCRCAQPDLTKAIAAAAELPTNSAEYASALQKVTELSVEESANIMLFTEPRIYAYDKSKVKGWPNDLIVPRLEGVTVN